MIYPRPLKQGDSVAIVSIDAKLVDGACPTLEAWGFRPVVGSCCKGECGSFSGTVGQRLGDLRAALENPDVRAVLCSRGGYGVVQMIEHFRDSMWNNDPKWLIGFSDISALHAVSVHAGVVSVHASMCKLLTEHPDCQCSHTLHDILTGKLPDYEVAGDERNREGNVSGTVTGGNLAVLSGLISTPYDLLKKDHILFIEDISEAIYRVERMLYTLRLNGTLARTKALIVGQFTDYKPSVDHQCMYDMIEKMVADYDFPVAYNFPVGHVDYNLPILEGAQADLTVTKDKVRLTFKR